MNTDPPALLATVVRAYAEQAAVIANHIGHVLNQALAHTREPTGGTIPPLSHHEWEQRYAWLEEDEP